MNVVSTTSFRKWSTTIKSIFLGEINSILTTILHFSLNKKVFFSFNLCLCNCGPQNKLSFQKKSAAEINKGPVAIFDLKILLGFGVGQYGHKFGKSREGKRKRKADVEAKQEVKKRRKMRAEARERARMEKETEEGGPAYKAGMM